MVGKWMTVAVAATMLAGLALAQGPGGGRGYGRGGGYGCGAGMCVRAGSGTKGAGWWTVATPKTPEQKALLGRMKDLHVAMQATAQELRQLRVGGASAEQIRPVADKLRAQQAEIRKLVNANRKTLTEMGVPAWVCTGQCPMGGGMGAGCGLGPGGGRRDGSGPNPNCPLKK